MNNVTMRNDRTGETVEVHVGKMSGYTNRGYVRVDLPVPKPVIERKKERDDGEPQGQ